MLRELRLISKTNQSFLHHLFLSHLEDFDARIKTINSSTFIACKNSRFSVEILFEKIKPVTKEILDFRKRTKDKFEVNFWNFCTIKVLVQGSELTSQYYRTL